MNKLYSIEHISKVYNVDVEIIKKWAYKKFNGKPQTMLPRALNNEIATFLGVEALNLKAIKKVKINQGKTRVQPNKKKQKERERQRERQKQREIQKQREKKKNTINNYISKIKRAKYKEEASNLLERLKKIIDIKTRTIKTINKIYKSLPTEKQYILENCEKQYFTWKDMTFTEKGLRVDPNIIYLTIEIEGLINILNDINEAYFQKKYEKDLYKVYINKFDRTIEYELSKDIKKIQTIVFEHIEIYKNKKIFIQRTNISKENFNHSKEISIEDILRIFGNNKFIQEASKFLNKGSKAIALWENNNSILEESILIILSHKFYTFVIWENINDNRACYIFKYRTQGFDTKLNVLKKFINSYIEYKRWDLFNNKGNANSLNYEKYYTVIHKDLNDYKRKLNIHLNPYFYID